MQPDFTTAIVVLTHDDKFDVPLLQAALDTEALYIGALGARRNQERRRARACSRKACPRRRSRASTGPPASTSAAARRPRRRWRSSPRSSPSAPGRSGGSLREAKGRINANVP